MVSVIALADVLIEGLNPQLPEGCWLERGTSKERGGVWLFIDDVVHATQGTAWPTDPETPQPLPECWATVEEGVLSFGYGSRIIARDVRLIDLSA
jgi:hypothetical protein